MNVSKMDVSKKKRGAQIAAGVMVALILLWDLFVLTINSYDPAPLPVILLLTVPATLVIIGIVLALRERMKEIDGGEEDEAVKY